MITVMVIVIVIHCLLNTQQMPHFHHIMLNVIHFRIQINLNSKTKLFNIYQEKHYLVLNTQ